MSEREYEMTTEQVDWVDDHSPTKRSAHGSWHVNRLRPKDGCPLCAEQAPDGAMPEEWYVIAAEYEARKAAKAAPPVEGEKGYYADELPCMNSFCKRPRTLFGGTYCKQHSTGRLW